MKDKPAKSYLTTAQKKALREQHNSIPPDVQAAFDSAFRAWKSTWFSGGLAINSDPHTRTVGKEFDATRGIQPRA